MWQVHCVRLGFKHDFLLRGLLAVAAYEMCYERPDKRQEYHLIASNYQSLALTSYRETLQDVNESNCHALFAFSCILIVMAFASSTKEQPSDFNSDVLQWFYLLRGANMVLNMHAENIRCSFLKPLLDEMDTMKTTVGSLFIQDIESTTNFIRPHTLFLTPTALLISSGYAVSQIMSVMWAKPTHWPSTPCSAPSPKHPFAGIATSHQYWQVSFGQLHFLLSSSTY